jgi:hypothetical protein
MKDYVVYHNPDVMSSELAATDDDRHSIVTDKKVSDVRGSRVWLLTGKGSPRTFSLHSYFVVDDIQPGTEDGFQTRLAGAGEGFDPMPTLNDEEWFDDFKRTLGNFAFGFQHITEPRFIEGLEAVAKRN